jgi:anti-sigma factor RsiW
MTSCERAQSLFGRAWDDELTAVERDGLELHVKGCAGCRREYDEFARTLELVQTLPRPAVSVDFAARVLVAAQAREREAAAAPRRIFAWPSLPSFEFGDIAFGRPALALAATFVVAVSAAVVLMRGPAVGPTQAPTVATGAPQAQSVPAPVVEAAPVVRAPATMVAAGPTSRPVRRAAGPAQVAEAPMIPDSLFDHTADVELVLDPVKLRRERGVGYTPTSVRGEAASITF